MSEANVFISWSGSRSKAMAEALRDWLPHVIQSAVPFFSDKDIASGAFWDDTIRASLKSVDFAVVCCTPENVIAPWLNYEAGALVERMKGGTAPWLLDSKPEELQPSPLSRLQAKAADRDGTLAVLQTLNGSLPSPLAPQILASAFQTHWVALEEKLKAIPAAETKTPQRDPRDMLEEIVGLCRRIASERQSPDNALLASAFDALTAGRLGGHAFGEDAMGPIGGAGFAWHRLRPTATRLAQDLAEQLYFRPLTDDELEHVLLSTRKVFKKRGGNPTELGSLLAVEMVRFLGSPEPIG
jgi:hypothetical protein